MVRPGFAPQSRIWLHDVVDFAEALEGEVFALERDEEFVGGGEGVGHQDAERRRAIEEDEVERGDRRAAAARAARRRVRWSSARATSISAPARSRSPGMIQRCSQRVGIDFVGDRGVAEQRPVDGLCPSIGGEAERAGGIGLRVEVDEEHARARAARQAARLTEVVVLPTPPFWLATAMIFIGARNCSAERVFDEKECGGTGAERFSRGIFSRVP